MSISRVTMQVAARVLLALLVLTTTMHGAGALLPRNLFAVISDRDGSTHILLYDAPTGHLFNLTLYECYMLGVDCTLAYHRNPVWSPDGRTLFYDADLRSGINGVYRKTLFERQIPIRLSSGKTPRVAPDGEHVISASWQSRYPDQHGRSYVLSQLRLYTTGGRLMRDLTPDPERHALNRYDAASNADWSPDGSQIVYQHNDTASTSHVYVMAADGSDSYRLDTGSDYSRDPAWSPDGSQIALWSLRQTDDGVHRAGLYLTDPQGHNWRLLVEMNGGSPAWSPDGSQIAFDALYDNARQAWTVYVVAVGSGAWRALIPPHPDASFMQPAWQPR